MNLSLNLFQGVGFRVSGLEKGLKKTRNPKLSRFKVPHTLKRIKGVPGAHAKARKAESPKALQGGPPLTILTVVKGLIT